MRVLRGEKERRKNDKSEAAAYACRSSPEKNVANVPKLGLIQGRASKAC
jgi:hypothetical protein